MKSFRLKDSVELVGISAIVASLIFVGMELRQSQEIAIASQYQARVQFNLKFFDTVDDNGLRQFSESARTVLADLDLQTVEAAQLAEMTPVEFGKILITMRRIMFIFDNSHFQYQAGFMDEESWQAIRRRTKQVFGNSLIVKIDILEQSFQWRDSLVLEVERMIQEVEDER